MLYRDLVNCNEFNSFLEGLMKKIAVLLHDSLRANLLLLFTLT